MAHTTITLSMEAYGALKRQQREGESFSREILRLATPPSITEVFGIFSDKEAKEMHKTLKELRKEKVREWRS